MTERTTKFRITEKQAVGAAMLASARKLPIPIPAVLAFATIVIVIAYLLPGRSNGLVYDILLPLLMGLIVGVVLLQYVYLPWKVRQHHRQAASFRDEITLKWDDERFKLNGERGSIDFAWTDFHRWSENDDLLLLYHSELLFHIVPKVELSERQRVDIIAQVTAADLKKR
ncbi:YcxB family protein [Altererythrobacter sp. ZODW24]|uniref:YcxB family protein n=1 Tax=Altererythrobacter sp. ZODW24 TaxID=2185142 RepID=UPI000DF7E2BF|nr:YcxB family protein [Altererythrobacter sp. ZODW24]